MKYSFVIPCYRSENTITYVVNEIMEETKKEQLTDYEIILVNDCSPDHVWEVIKKLSKEYSCIHGVNLARNFGQHSALLAGYARTKGDIIISLDDDGQAPMDELYKLLEKLDEENDVVYAYYKEVKQNLFRRFGSLMADYMNKMALNMPEGFHGSSFFVAKRYVIDEMLRYDNAYPYLLGLVFRATQKIGCVETNHRKRLEGTSGYNLKSLLALWLNGFTAFSVKPLEMGMWLGFFFAAAGFVGTIVTIIHKLCNPLVAVGWSSIVCILLMLGGIIMLMLGLIGEYVGRIYICINKSPQYVVREDTFEQNNSEESEQK